MQGDMMITNYRTEKFTFIKLQQKDLEYFS